MIIQESVDCARSLLAKLCVIIYKQQPLNPVNMESRKLSQLNLSCKGLPQIFMEFMCLSRDCVLKSKQVCNFTMSRTEHRKQTSPLRSQLQT